MMYARSMLKAHWRSRLDGLLPVARPVQTVGGIRCRRNDIVGAVLDLVKHQGLGYGTGCVIKAETAEDRRHIGEGERIADFFTFTQTGPFEGLGENADCQS